MFGSVLILIVKFRHKVTHASNLGLLSIVVLGFPIISFSSGISTSVETLDTIPVASDGENKTSNRFAGSEKIDTAISLFWDYLGFKDKTLWDWLENILIPLLIPLIVVGLSVFLGREARSFAKRAQHERDLAADRSREEALRAYLERLTDLVLKEKLKESPIDSPERAVAQAHTFAALRSLDGTRKGILLRFLQESRLLAKINPIISLEGADLTQASLAGADLGGLSMNGVDLRHAVLDEAIFQETDLQYADLSNSSMREAQLERTDLRYAILHQADMSEANLIDANLSVADLTEAIFQDATINNVNLFRADLSDAKIEIDQLRDAENVLEAILPDGTEMDVERWNQLKKSP